MPFRVSFSPTQRAWVARVEDSPALSWAAASPLEALAGVIALTPVPDGISNGLEDRDGRERYDEYVRQLVMSGAARGCACSKPGCHCDGIADNTPLGYDTCGCCAVDCPDVHAPGDEAPDVRIRQPIAADPLPERQMPEVPGCSRCAGSSGV